MRAWAVALCWQQQQPASQPARQPLGHLLPVPDATKSAGAVLTTLEPVSFLLVVVTVGRGADGPPTLGLGEADVLEAEALIDALRLTTGARGGGSEGGGTAGGDATTAGEAGTPGGGGGEHSAGLQYCQSSPSCIL
jgi:hypothetical protein